MTNEKTITTTDETSIALALKVCKINNKHKKII
jgi:hypothetical protein